MSNSILVAKKINFGSKLPLDRQPIYIDKIFLTDNVLEIMNSHGNGYFSEFGIDPIWTTEFLRLLPDSFMSRRLKVLFIKEFHQRLKSSRSIKTKNRILNVFSGLENVKIGSYDLGEDEVFIPVGKTRLAVVINMPTRNESCQQKNNTQMEQSSALTL